MIESVDRSVGRILDALARLGVREKLLERGLSRVLVEAGGSGGGVLPPGEAGWAVDIPHGTAGDSSRVSTVAHAAVATSGDDV